jgi:hypothetical protein
MTAKKKILTAIKSIANGLELHLSSGKLGPRGQELYQQVRVMLNERARRFTLTVERLSDLEDQRTLFTESAFFIVPAIAVAHQSGKSQAVQKMWRAISKQQKQKTAKARSAALAKRWPQKEAKVNITIECAKAYLANIQLKPKSPNALAITIRPDVESKCKLSGIAPPSLSSIAQYLKKAGLGS